MTTPPVPRRLRSSRVALGLTVVAASALTSGCAEETPDYQAICVDPTTEERVDDDECSEDEDPEDYSGGGGGFFWFYLAANSTRPLPAVGSRYDPRAGTFNGSSLTRNGRYVVRGGAPTAGASSVKSYVTSTVKSGGFGGKGVSSS